MEFRDWDKVLYGIGRGECILFLGPELPSISPEGERRVPLEALAERLRAGLEDTGPEIDARDLPHVAQRYLAQEGDVALEMEVCRWHEELTEPAGPASALHDDLAALPWKWIVTSGHDPLIGDALRRAGKSPAIGRYHYRGPTVELLPEPSVEAPVLYHLYGHVEEPPSLVLTETQLLDFLANLIARDPPLPNDLNETLANGRLFLFLGFGLRRWYLRILLRVLKVLRHGNRAFALEPSGDESEDAILFYRQNFKMDLFHDDVARFARELRERYEAAAERSRAPAGTSGSPESSGGGASTARLAPGTPTVFLCHASEDAGRAREVHDALKRAGLRPWLDKNSLRGGDRWDDLIESTIEEVDFFIVLNSRSLAAKSRERSYVNKEIKRALKADELHLLGSFIIPALTDDEPLLEPLSEFQAVDLTAADGLRRLVRAIKRQVEAA